MKFILKTTIKKTHNFMIQNKNIKKNLVYFILHI